MGCLSVSANRIGKCIKCNANSICQGIEVSAYRIGKGIHCEAEILNEMLNVSASRIGKRIQVDAHIICTLNKSAYLNAIPDTLWLTPDILASADFEIISNVNWNIV